MKGKWLVELVARVLDGSANPRDAYYFMRARFARKPVNMEFAKVLFNDADHVLWSIVADIFINQVYTPKGFRIRNGDTVVDIGAHKGVFVAYAAQFSPKMTLAIEPDKKNIAYLEKLIKLNGLQNITLVNAAVAENTVSDVPLFMAVSSSRNSLLGKDVVTGIQLKEAQRVNTITLDDVIKKTGHVDFMKMDCEGAEFPILLSAKMQLFSYVNKIALEYHAARSSPQLRDLIRKLEAVYKDVEVSRSHPAMGYIFAKN
jgi:FkbM family methyltransferase